MDSVVDIAESRKARNEKSEQLREISNALLLLLETHRQHLSEEFMTFLLAMAMSDQAMHYADLSGQKQDGKAFIENLFTTAQLLFDSHYMDDEPLHLHKTRLHHPPDENAGQVLHFGEHHPPHPQAAPE